MQGALRNQDLPFQRVVEPVQPDGAAPSAQLVREPGAETAPATEEPG